MVEMQDAFLKVLSLDDRISRVEAEQGRRAKPADAPAEDEMDDRLLNAKIEASEARTDAKFAELKGLLASAPSRWDVWGGLLALFVAILGILAFGGDRLALGIGLADTRQEQLERDRAQDATANEINAKLDRLLAAESARPTTGR